MLKIQDHLENTSAPFFVHLSFVSPHPPSTPPHPWDKLYTDEDLPPINYKVGDVERLPYQTRMLLDLLGDYATDQDYFNSDYSLNETVVSKERRMYHGLASYVDEQLGRVADFIDGAGLGPTTLLIFTSDHGSMLYDHGAPNEKHSFHEGSWHVPMLMRQPGRLPANVLAGMSTTIDVTASILQAAGAEYSKQDEQEQKSAWESNVTFFMSGLDLYTPLVRGEASPRTAVAATEYRGYAVVTAKWKLIYMAEQDEGRLFDRIHDVLEREDLWDNSAYESVKNTLLVGLLRWRAQQDDLQLQLRNWNGAAEVGIRARADSELLSGRDAELNLQCAAAQADAEWEPHAHGSPSVDVNVSPVFSGLTYYFFQSKGLVLLMAVLLWCSYMRCFQQHWNNVQLQVPALKNKETDEI